jgi:hypothetical protein
LLQETSSIGRFNNYTNDSYLHDHLSVKINDENVYYKGKLIPKTFRAEWLITVNHKDSVSQNNGIKARLLLTLDIFDQEIRMLNFWYDVLSNQIGVEYEVLQYIVENYNSFTSRSVEEIHKKYNLENLSILSNNIDLMSNL